MNWDAIGAIGELVGALVVFFRLEPSGRYSRLVMEDCSLADVKGTPPLVR